MSALSVAIPRTGHELLQPLFASGAFMLLGWLIRLDAAEHL